MNYRCAERDEILKYKWIESERLGYDIGRNRAAQEWCDKYAKSFRDHWEMEHPEDV